MSEFRSLMPGLVAAVLVAGALLPAAARAQDLPTPKVYYDFEDEIVEGVVPDKSGEGRDGVWGGGAIVAAAGAPSGSTPAKGFQFPGGNGCISVDYLVSELLGPDFFAGGYTMSAWILPSAVAGDHFLFGQASQGLHLGIRNGGVLHQAHWSDDSNAATPLVPNEWVHAVWVYEREFGEGRIYLDGIVDALHGKADPNVIDSTLIIGAHNGCSNQGFDGVADDIAIWSEVLSDAQIQALSEGASPIGAVSGDIDGDGLPDSYELAVAMNLDDLAAEPNDFDGDGRTDFEEFSQPPNTDPTKFDTDGDMLGDGEELVGVGSRPPTDPLRADTDNDGLTDQVEDNGGVFVDANMPGTDPTNANTDGTGGTDGTEVANNTDPLDPNDPPGSGPLNLPPPVIYYSFDSLNEGVIPNESGDDFDGVTTGGALTAGAPGSSTPGSGFNFPDLEMACVQTALNVSDLLAQAGGYTMMAWIRPSATFEQHYVFGQTNQGLHLGIRNGGVLHQAHWNDDSNAATPLFENEWVHATWVYDRAEGLGRIYLDGFLDAEHTKGDPNITDADLILGNVSGCGGDRPYTGDMDDVAVWAEVLSDEQILGLAQGASPLGVVPTDPGDEFRINEIVRVGPDVQITWPSDVGTRYFVESSGTLVAPWDELADIVATETQTSFTTPAGSEDIYLRVRREE